MLNNGKFLGTENFGMVNCMNDQIPIQTELNSDTSQFWKTRFATYGHTGWSDRFIYEFDQPCRLFAFSSWLGTNLPAAGKALDFGCGTADFARLLIGLGWSVIGYDRYVKPRFTHSKFEYLNVLPDTVEQKGFYDLIISITVMDHIMDNAEFLGSLLQIRQLLKPSGSFFFLEYSNSSFRQPSAIQMFRTMQTCREYLERAGLQLIKNEPFFHPDDAPIPAWEAYKKHPYLQIARMLLKCGFKGKIPECFLRNAAKACLRRHGYTAPQTSPLNILTGHPAYDRYKV